ncbi:hypothetical protein WDW37_01105 [Bdellovibrionota bacterium FG-1]
MRSARIQSQTSPRPAAMLLSFLLGGTLIVFFWLRFGDPPRVEAQNQATIREVARYLETEGAPLIQQLAQTPATAPKITPASPMLPSTPTWADHAEARGFGDFERQVDAYFPSSNEGQSLKKLLILDQHGTREDALDVTFAAQQLELLERKPTESLQAIQDVLNTIPTDWSYERHELLNLTSHLANKEGVHTEPAKEIILGEIRGELRKNANRAPAQDASGQSVFTTSYPAQLLETYFGLESDPKLREEIFNSLHENPSSPDAKELIESVARQNGLAD